MITGCPGISSRLFATHALDVPSYCNTSPVDIVPVFTSLRPLRDVAPPPPPPDTVVHVTPPDPLLVKTCPLVPLEVG